MKNFVIVLLSTFFITGCFGIHPSENQTIISTRNYDLTNKNLQLGKQVVGNSQNWGQWGQVALQEAVEDAISRNNCTVALINVKTTNNGQTIEGTEVIDPTLGNCAK